MPVTAQKFEIGQEKNSLIYVYWQFNALMATARFPTRNIFREKKDDKNNIKREVNAWHLND